MSTTKVQTGIGTGTEAGTTAVQLRRTATNSPVKHIPIMLKSDINSIREWTFPHVVSYEIFRITDNAETVRNSRLVIRFGPFRGGSEDHYKSIQANMVKETRACTSLSLEEQDPALSVDLRHVVEMGRITRIGDVFSVNEFEFDANRKGNAKKILKGYGFSVLDDAIESLQRK